MTEDDDSFGDCDNTDTPNGPAYKAVKLFAESEAAFIEGYAVAWDIATTNGFTGLTPIGSGIGVDDFKFTYGKMKVAQACDFSIW